MKKFMIALFILFTFSSLSQIAYAATSEVTWTDYKKYRDIRPGSESRKHFRERTFNNFEKHFAKLAQNLPVEEVLKINVTDVDLAGDTHAGGVNQVRIIKEIYYPRMKFSYELINADGQVITSGNVDLKDMRFMVTNNKYRNQSLSYEKKMLDAWFVKTFKAYVVKEQ